MTEKPDRASAQAVQGVFAAETTTTVGFGATKRRVQQVVYLYAEEKEPGVVTCTPLSQNYTPAGAPRNVTREELLAKFKPEPHIYLQKYLPAMARVERMVDDADRCREQGQLFTSEFEYKNALRLDENHIRASFGLGLTYLERGDTQNAHVVFRKLSRLEGAFDPEYKHLFNEFGIQLRKNSMHAQALGHYAKALRLSPRDEHLLLNMARALLEKGRPRPALRLVERALALRADHAAALRFKEYLDRKLGASPAPPVEMGMELIADSSLEAQGPGPSGSKGGAP
ncbi:Beta-barrel assembly-enhancing protease [Fundidesulfovibrio magnetotacticus]|uniref:Beta-barrel assembly-enhancing protease n=1 Tax=Fundidesulfovibrio magnetotacticus TaxID=2730080 RepID=A0A6V8LVJ4_9BACT|nr:tetratricopeptide repeat protein [Fundidesulfovibrio magnetotacticus]GFK93836.1 Beta-barrel assembly-enhancing protease [Fundidesulfovibrio magnetotacticus]